MPRRKRHRQEASKAAAKPSKAPTRKASARLLNSFLVVIILGAVAVVLLTPRPQHPTAEQTAPLTGTTPLPKPIEESDGQGATFARIDHDKLAAWSRERGLPEPPELGRMEPPVARTLYGALRKVADEPSGVAYGRVGQILESLDCHAAAAAYFEKAHDAAPSEYRWPYYLGCIHQLLGRNVEALTAFDMAQPLGPDYPVLYARVGQIYLEEGRLDEAKSAFTRYRELSPNDSLGYVGLGRIALQRGNTDEALSLLQQAVAKVPADFQAHNYLGRAWLKAGEEEKAREHFEMSADLPQGKWFYIRDPLDQELHRAAGSTQSLVSYFEQISRAGTDYAKMVEVAEQILRRRPGDMTMIANLAGLYRKLGRMGEAHALLDKALADHPDLARLHSVRSTIFLAQDDYDNAVASADRAIALGDDTVEPVNVKGRALFMLRRLPEAEAAMKRAVEMDPRNPGIVYVYGETLLMQGRREEAIEQFRRVLTFAPGFQPVLKRMEELQE